MRAHFLPMDSYRGQHALLVAILALLLVAVAWVGYSYVQNASTRTIIQIEQRATVTANIVNIRSQLAELQQWLQWQITSPENQNKETLELALDRIREAMIRLQYAGLFTSTDALQNLTLPLEQDYLELEQSAHQLMEVTGDLATRLPNVNALMDELLPRSEAIITALNTLAFEISEDLQKTNPALLSNIMELRYSWLRNVSEFRLYVANRFGVFSNIAEDGMEARMKNITLYEQHFILRLQSLQSTAAQHPQFFLDENIWSKMSQDANIWFAASARLRDELKKENWRQDIRLFNTTFSPIVTKVKQHISTIEKKMDIQVSTDITGLNNIAKNLSDAIILLAILGVSLVLFGYFYLEHRLIIPIAETTAILKKEAQGISDHKLPNTGLLETRNLIEAFQEMREQVRVRQLSLDHMAHHDALTQLPNRVLFRDRIQHALRIAAPDNKKTGLIFLDLDRFKQVNDSLGHLAGDKLLTVVAKRLTNSVSDSDTVARLSGDEFAILVESIPDNETIASLSKNILENLGHPVEIYGHKMHISASLGIAIAPADGNEVNELIRKADLAMYEAKRQGKAHYQFFSASMAQPSSDPMRLEQQLREALKHQEFDFHFQPVIDMKTGSPVCFEALLRWQPEHGPTRSPNSFLAALLDTGLIAEVTEHMLNQIGDAQEHIQRTLNIPVHITFNVAGPILRSENAYTTLLKAICDSNIQRQHLTVEITEDTLTEDIAHAEQFLAALKSENIQIALDDFGTGQSSLSHVRTFPFDIIKIDKEFVRDILSDPKDASLVKVIIQLAHSFGMKVVAEGVETTEQFNFLLHADCDMAQGFMISEALPLDQMVAYLRQQVTSLATDLS